ncbi:MAG: hypothetical protein GQE15_03165 [Archangiaceae bacterium]|nr:hypothetical protein [Archangiaceae bacterium]
MTLLLPMLLSGVLVLPEGDELCARKALVSGLVRLEAGLSIVQVDVVVSVAEYEPGVGGIAGAVLPGVVLQMDGHFSVPTPKRGPRPKLLHVSASVRDTTSSEYVIVRPGSCVEFRLFKEAAVTH